MRGRPSAPLVAFAVGALAWGIPLLVASGGLAAYLQALRFQADADFAGVVMLWTHHSPREAAHALINTFIWPWDWWLGIAVCVLATGGAARIAWRAPRVLVTILLAFAPYAIFHLLFQETETTRYALPLLPVVAYAAMAAVEGLPARALPVAALGIAAISLMQALPASVHVRARRRAGVPRLRRHGRDRARRRSRRPDRDARRRAARRRLGDADPAGTRGQGAARPRVADARRVVEGEAVRARLVSRGSGSDGSGAVRSPCARPRARLSMGLHRAAVCRRRQAGQRGLVPHAGAELDARSGLVDHGGSGGA